MNQAAAPKLAESGDVLVLTQHLDDREGEGWGKVEKQRTNTDEWEPSLHCNLHPVQSFSTSWQDNLWGLLCHLMHKDYFKQRFWMLGVENIWD